MIRGRQETPVFFWGDGDRKQWVSGYVGYMFVQTVDSGKAEDKSERSNQCVS